MHDPFLGFSRRRASRCPALLTAFACICLAACNGDSGPTPEEEAAWAKEAEIREAQKQASIQRSLKWSQEATAAATQTVKPKPPKRPVKVDPFIARFSQEIMKFRDTDADNFAELEELFEKARADGRVHLGTIKPVTSWAYDAMGPLPDPTEELYAKHIAKFERWQQAYPESSTPLIAGAGAYLHWAFFARGDGYAYTVAPEAWKPFNERNLEAKQLLLEAEKRGVADAHLYETLIQLGKADGSEREDVDEWFEKGKKLDPNCLPLYAVMTEYLLPRWHGLPGEIREFADRMAEELPGELGQTVYLKIAMTQALYEPSVVMRGDFDLDALHTAAQLVANRWPDAVVTNEFCAHIAWLKQDLPLAKQTWHAMQGELTACWWSYDDRNKARFEKFCDRTAAPARCDRLIWNPTNVSGVRFLNSGNQLVTYNWAVDALKVWDIETGKQVAAVPLPLHINWSLDRHPTLDRLLIAIKVSEPSVESAMIIDLDSPADSLTLYDAGLGHFRALRYSPDGQRVAGVHGGDGQYEDILSLWNATTGELERKVDLPEAMNDLVFSPDGKQLSFNRQSIYHLESEEWSTFAKPVNNDFSVQWIDCGGFIQPKVLVGLVRRSKNPNTILATWDLVAQKSSDIVEVPGGLSQMCASRSRRLVAAVHTPRTVGAAQGLRKALVFDLTQRKLLTTIPGLPDGIADIDFSPDERWLAFGCGDGGTRLYRLPESGAEASDVVETAAE